MTKFNPHWDWPGPLRCWCSLASCGLCLLVPCIKYLKAAYIGLNRREHRAYIGLYRISLKKLLNCNTNHDTNEICPSHVRIWLKWIGSCASPRSVVEENTFQVRIRTISDYIGLYLRVHRYPLCWNAFWLFFGVRVLCEGYARWFSAWHIWIRVHQTKSGLSRRFFFWNTLFCAEMLFWCLRALCGVCSLVPCMTYLRAAYIAHTSGSPDVRIPKGGAAGSWRPYLEINGFGARGRGKVIFVYHGKT